MLISGSMLKYSLVLLFVAALIGSPALAQSENPDPLIAQSQADAEILSMIEGDSFDQGLSLSSIASPVGPRRKKPASLLKLCCLAFGCKFEVDPILGDVCGDGPKDCDYKGFQSCWMPPLPNPGPVGPPVAAVLDSAS